MEERDGAEEEKRGEGNREGKEQERGFLVFFFHFGALVFCFWFFFSLHGFRFCFLVFSFHFGSLVFYFWTFFFHTGTFCFCFVCCGIFFVCLILFFCLIYILLA